MLEEETWKKASCGKFVLHSHKFLDIECWNTAGFGIKTQQVILTPDKPGLSVIEPQVKNNPQLNIAKSTAENRTY